jgi:type IV pilus assembly protein PilF
MIRNWMLLCAVVAMLQGCASDSAAPNKLDPNADNAKATQARLDAGWGYLAGNNLAAAKRHLDKAFAYSPNHSDVNRALGHYFERVGEKEEAEKHYRKAVSLNSKNGDALSDYGAFLCRAGKFAKAQEMFDDAIKVPAYENVAGTLENAGICTLNTGNSSGAEDFFLRALRHNPKQPGALLEMANIEFERKRLERAKQYFQRYTEVRSDNARSLWIGVQINQALGDKNAVASMGLKLERMYPDAEETLKYLDAKAKWRK